MATIYDFLGETAGVGLKQRGQFPTEEAETETGSSHCLSEGDLESEKDLEHCSTLSFPPGLEARCSTAAQRSGVTVRDSPAAWRGAQGFASPAAAQTLLEGLRSRGSGVLAQLPHQDRRANKKAPPTQKQQQQQQQGPQVVLGGGFVQRQQPQRTTVQATRAAAPPLSWLQTVKAPVNLRVGPAPALDEWILPEPMKVLLRTLCGTHLNLDPTMPVKKKPLLCSIDGPTFPQLSPASVSISQLAMV